MLEIYTKSEAYNTFWDEMIVIFGMSIFMVWQLLCSFRIPVDNATFMPDNGCIFGLSFLGLHFWEEINAYFWDEFRFEVIKLNLQWNFCGDLEIYARDVNEFWTEKIWRIQICNILGWQWFIFEIFFARDVKIKMCDGGLFIFWEENM